MVKKVLAIVPAYNEEGSIVSTIEDLMANASEVDYVIIDDGSKDSTAEICATRGYNHISLPVNLGLAGGFQVGMKYALRNGYDYAVQFDADGQHAASYIRQMVECAEKTGSDIVIGSRFCATKRSVSARMVGSVLISGIIRFTTGLRIKDPTSGMRLFGREMIPLFANELDYSPEPDTIALVARNGAKVSEVEVQMRDRVAGKSYLNFTKSVSYMLRVCLSILFVQWFRGRSK